MGYPRHNWLALAQEPPVTVPPAAGQLAAAVVPAGAGPAVVLAAGIAAGVLAVPGRLGLGSAWAGAWPAVVAGQPAVGSLAARTGSR